MTLHVRIAVLAVCVATLAGCGPKKKDGDAGQPCIDGRTCVGQGLMCCPPLSGQDKPTCKLTCSNFAGCLSSSDCADGTTVCCPDQTCRPQSECPKPPCASMTDCRDPGTICCPDHSCQLAALCPHACTSSLDCADGSTVCCPDGFCRPFSECPPPLDFSITADLASEPGDMASSADMSSSASDMAAKNKFGEFVVEASGSGVAMLGAFYTITVPTTTTEVMQAPQGACKITIGVFGTAGTSSNDGGGNITISGPGGSFNVVPAGNNSYNGSTGTAIATTGQNITISWAGNTVPAGSATVTRVADTTLGCTLTDGQNVPRNMDFNCPFSGGSGGDFLWQITQVSGNNYRQALCQFSGAGSNALIPTGALSGFNAGAAELALQLQSKQTVNAGGWDVLATWLGQPRKTGGVTAQPPIGINLQ